MKLWNWLEVLEINNDFTENNLKESSNLHLM